MTISTSKTNIHKKFGDIEAMFIMNYGITTLL